MQNQSLACLSHVSKSEHFRQDLSMNKSCWIYTDDAEMRRCLLIQRKVPAEGDKKQEVMRELGAHAVA